MESTYGVDLCISISISTTNDVFHKVTSDEVELQSTSFWVSLEWLTDWYIKLVIELTHIDVGEPTLNLSPAWLTSDPINYQQLRI